MFTRIHGYFINKQNEKSTRYVNVETSIFGSISFCGLSKNLSFKGT